VTPRCPSIAQRLALIAQAHAAGLKVQVAVSPCLPYSSAETFGKTLLQSAHRVVVDTFVSGDGQWGTRTARTGIEAVYGRQGWGDWRSEDAAHRLHAWLEQRIGPRAGWSQDGFAALVRESISQEEAEAETAGVTAQ
jgi:hypothetical protein